MKVRIKNWDSSLALRIPKSVAAECGIERGMLVDVSVVKDTLVIAPVTDKEHTLKELVDGVTKRNIHGEINTGPWVGKELW